MGTWQKILYRMLQTLRKLRIIVIRNGFDQAVEDDGLNAILKKNRQNVTCRPHRVTGLEREVLIEID